MAAYYGQPAVDLTAYQILAFAEILASFQRRHAPKSDKQSQTVVGRVVGRGRRGRPAASPFERAAEVAARKGR